MKRKIYLSFVLIFLAVLFVSCRCQEVEIIEDDTSLVFGFSTGGGCLGFIGSELSINANATHYSHENQPMQIKFQRTVRTNTELWDYLKNAFDLDAFRSIGEGECTLYPYDVTGRFKNVFSVTIDDDKTFSFTKIEGYSFDNDENFQKMIPFFNALENLAWSFH